MVRFEWGRRTYIMGILNVTPDSFSGDGILAGPRWLEAAVAQAQALAAAGADIIDIGGESTRPGSTPVSPDEEQRRILPVVKAVREVVSLPISVDTYRAAVAAVALEVGADWVNDIWGLRMDPQMPGLIARQGCPVVIMHNGRQPAKPEMKQWAGSQTGTRPADMAAAVCRELQESIDLALAEGIHPSQLIVDPGIGFDRTVEQNLRLIQDLDQLRALGYPILLGASRKGFIGRILGLPPQERVEGTAATVAIGIDRGADIIRVHDVQAMVRVARMTDQIVRSGQQASAATDQQPT